MGGDNYNSVKLMVFNLRFKNNAFQCLVCFIVVNKYLLSLVMTYELNLDLSVKTTCVTTAKLLSLKCR